MTEIIPLSEKKNLVITEAHFNDYVEFDHVQNIKNNNLSGDVREAAADYSFLGQEDLISGLANNWGMPDYVHMDSISFIANHLHDTPLVGKTYIDDDPDLNTLTVVPANYLMKTKDDIPNTSNSDAVRNGKLLLDSEKNDIVPYLKLPKDMMLLNRNNNDNTLQIGVYHKAKFFKINFKNETKDGENLNSIEVYFFLNVVLVVPEILNDFIFNDKCRKYKSFLDNNQIDKILSSLRQALSSLMGETNLAMVRARVIGWCLRILLSNYYIGYMKTIEEITGKNLSIKQKKVNEDNMKVKEFMEKTAGKLAKQTDIFNTSYLICNLVFIELKCKLDVDLSINNQLTKFTLGGNTKYSSSLHNRKLSFKLLQSDNIEVKIKYEYKTRDEKTQHLDRLINKGLNLKTILTKVINDKIHLNDFKEKGLIKKLDNTKLNQRNILFQSLVSPQLAECFN
jgi:hypothetical protein